MATRGRICSGGGPSSQGGPTRSNCKLPSQKKLKAIEYFIASCEEGSFARAAQRLEVSVPAVQRLVGALEGSLGFALLEHGARGVRPTPGGREYLDRCGPLLSDLDELGQAERALRGSSERASGTLDVAAHPQLAHQVLLPAPPRFHALHPEVEIDFRTALRSSKRWAGGWTTRSPAPTGGSSLRSPACVNRQSASPGTVGKSLAKARNNL